MAGLFGFMNFDKEGPGIDAQCAERRKAFLFFLKLFFVIFGVLFP